MDAIDGLRHEAATCVRCPLATTRTQVVFGAGQAGAKLLVVTSAPGLGEDREGVPVAGPPGRLLAELLAAIGLTRDDAFVTPLVRCRPPDNREPVPAEIDACREWLGRLLDVLEPTVVVPLGNLATKVVRGDPAPVSKVHGVPEVLRLGTRAVHVVPLYHPAAALYARPLEDALRADVARLPELLAAGPPPQPELPPAPPPAEPDPGGAEQLGLF